MPKKRRWSSSVARLCLGVLASCAGTTLLTMAQTPAVSPPPRHYVFFGLDRHRIREASFLDREQVAGAQLKYTWRELEPEPGRYAFESMRQDLAFLDRHGKRMFVQIQDVSFSEDVHCVPDYLRDDPAFHGGADRQYEITGDDESTARPGGWVARRWDPTVRKRFVALLDALGDEFDGRLEGVNLPETAVEFGASGKLYPDGFTPVIYAESVKAIMTAAAAAFPRSRVIQYANFMPGEWLPWDDHGYLRSIYAHAARVGVGVGGPDLLPHRKGQQQHSHPLIAARPAGVVAGVAVQDGNFTRDPATGAPVTAAALVDFATRMLRLDYLFWGTEEPYYSRDILPYLTTFASTDEEQPKH